MISFICGVLKIATNELIYQAEIDSQTQKTNLWLPNGQRGQRGINKEFGINRYIPLCVKKINNKDLQNITGDYIQYLVITYNGKESEKSRHIYIYVYVCITEASCCTFETKTAL